MGVFGIEREASNEATEALVTPMPKDLSLGDEESGPEEVEEVEMDDRRASLADMRMVSENNQSLRLGGGALVSFPVKYIHPHNVRDSAYPIRQKGQRLNGAGVLKQGMKSINGRLNVSSSTTGRSRTKMVYPLRSG